MAWTIKEFKINELKARIGKSIHGMNIINFYYRDKVPNIRVYGGMKVGKGKFGNYFELDLKDDETKKFFKILGEQLQSLAGAYLDEKPWNLTLPDLKGGSSRPPKGFSSITFDRDKILKRNFG